MSNIPKLRFPEFKGEWEEKRLDSLSLINPKPGDLPEVFSYIDLESVKNGVLLQEKIIKKEEAPSRAQRLLEEKDILFQTVRPYQRNNYFFNSKSPTVASTGYAQFRVNKNNYPSFLYQYLYTNNFVKNVLDRCSGTSFPAISTNDLLEICLHIPSLAEQQKIADFLSNVDSVITAETKILNTLQKKKKALMQKLFTRQLRFKSADGTDFPAWEEKCIDEIAECIAGATPDTKKNEYWENGTIPWMSSGEVNKKYVYETDRTITQLGYKKCSTKMIPVNTVVIALAGQGKTRGTVALTKIELCTNQSLCAIINKSEYNSEYLFHYLSSQYQELRKISSGGDASRGGLNLKLVGSYRVPLPCKAEQQKIADCLSSLDSLIQTQQKVVTTWQQRKKALLQQMFI